MARPLGMTYDLPEAYERLIAPRYAPIAEALVRAARPRPGEHALELGAGTGLVTRLAAERIGMAGGITATDVTPGMLEVARRQLQAAQASFVLVDYARPLPFLDRSFDLVLSGLTYVQNELEPLEEVARVLRPGGRLALAMWGTGYGEVRLLSAARRSLGQPGFPSAAPGRAVERIRRAGFERVERRDLRLAPRFPSVDEYLRYRRAFGIPAGQTEAEWGRVLAAVRDEAGRRVAPDGSLTLDWAIVLVTAQVPRRGRGPGS